MSDTDRLIKKAREAYATKENTILFAYVNTRQEKNPPTMAEIAAKVYRENN